MLRIAAVSMVIFSLILAGLHDKYDSLHIEIISIIYTAFFIVGIVLFCLSSPISNSIKSSKHKILLNKLGQLSVCFSISLASVVFIFVGYVMYGHRLGTSIALLMIGVCGVLGSVLKSVSILLTKNSLPLRNEIGDFKKENKENETATNKFVKNEVLTASDHWDQAIVAAENNRRDEALREFGVAIAMNPNRFVSEIEP